ncbi:MAG: PAS domain S-box protein, partial [Calditrichaeota bacterium]|nr:PAS domain S-box protein [Calditrichota bacterium]
MRPSRTCGRRSVRHQSYHHHHLSIPRGMIVSVRSRMLLVMALFLASILVVLLVQRHSGQAAHRAIRETREDEIRQLLRDVIDLRGEPLRLFAYDYSYWDELVGYLKSPDPTWARENLEVGVLSFKLDGVRIVDLSGRLISEHWREGRAGPSNDSIHFPLATASPISLTNGSAVLSSDTLRPWFQHGFSRGADSELYEFRIAPIQPTSDAKRVSRPLGFLLAFKAWDDAHLGELTDMTGCELELAPVGSNGQPKTEESGTPHSGEAGSPQIILDIPLPPSGAAASAYLHVRYFSPSLARFHIEAAKPFTLFFATGSFGLLLALLLLNRWVAAPLKGLTRSLSEGSLEPARPLMAKSNEFGELARLLERFHVQRDELGRSRERLKTLIGNLPGMVYSVLPDEPGTILYISDGCRALTGYTPEELMGPIGRPFNSLVHPEDHDAAWGEIKRALAEGRRFQVVYRIVGRTGEIRWVREQGIGIFNREGKPERIDIFAEDITERRKNEQLLAEREEIFSTVVNSIQDLILLYDTTGRISGVWSGLLDHGDFRADIFIGKTDLEILGPEHGKIPSDAVQDALGGISQTVEFDVKESRMQRRIEANFAPVRSQDGSIVGVVSVARDVTAIREAERTIQLERDRFRLYLDAAAGIVAALDREGRILLINMPGAQLLGINREEAVGRDWFELTLRDESAAKWKNAFLKAVQDSREWSRRFESEIGRPPGGTRTFLWHITILRGSTGAEGGLIFGQDITYLKRAERALRESEEQYHQFFEDDLTGDFISTPEGRFIDCNAA